jgi:hypothetical protein
VSVVRTRLVALVLRRYSIYIILSVSFFSNGRGAIFWAAVGLIAALAVLALGGAARIRGHDRPLRR